MIRSSLTMAAALLAMGMPVRLHERVSAPESPIPFRHVKIDPNNTGADCKAIGDLNGDGFPDVIVADDTTTPLQWYEYPHWNKRVIDNRIVFTTDMQTGDVDNDGDTDIIVPDYPKGVILWYRNPLREGGAWVPVTIGNAHGHDLEVGDINRDKKLDVVVREGETVVFLQRTPTDWTRIHIPTGGRGGTALADLDRDGDLDIAQNGCWLECPANPSGEKWQRHEIAPGWPEDSGVAATDMNRDGRMDVLLAPAESSGKLIWYAAPADPRRGIWQPHVISDDISHAHTFKVADMDNDGDLDVVTAEMEQSPRKRIRVHRNQGDALKWKEQILAETGSHNIRVADIGRDGDMDVIGANWGQRDDSYSPVELWENRLR
jgi:hypothetical protein